MVARYKRELKERCKAIKETEKVDIKPRQLKTEIHEIKEASCEHPEDSMIYRDEPNTQRDGSVFEIDDKSPMSRLKNYLKNGNSEKEFDSKDKSPVGGLSKR